MSGIYSGTNWFSETFGDTRAGSHLSKSAFVFSVYHYLAFSAHGQYWYDGDRLAGGWFAGSRNAGIFNDDASPDYRETCGSRKQIVICI